MKIMLASGSPRRFDLLTQMGWEVEAHSLPFAEAETVEEAENNLKFIREHVSSSAQRIKSETAGENSSEHNIEKRKTLTVLSEKDMTLLSPYQNADLVCAYNALGKGRAAALSIGTNLPVIAADTIVVLDKTILGKPADTEDAARMLRILSGKAHQVKTATAVLYQDKTLLQVITTHVYFRALTEQEITWYVQTGEPLDKAGAYGIQGKGAVLVEKIEGSYDNVVGLPLTTVYEMLVKAGVRIRGNECSTENCFRGDDP